MKVTMPGWLTEPFRPGEPLLWAMLSAAFWLACWYLPWQEALPARVWAQLGGALMLFMVPGACLYGLLLDRDELTFSHLTFGFVISHLIFALLGTFGRLFQLSFDTLKLGMAILGVVLMVSFLRRKFQNGIRLTPQEFTADRVFPLAALLLISMAAFFIVIQRVPADDDMSYLAYLTHWQFADRMDFNDLIFGEPALVHSRFWLMSAPFAQALLADLSHVPGILILSGYYEPFLVLISVLCWYELARALRFSPQAASVSVVLHLTFLLLLSDYLHPGYTFFSQLNSDKATATLIIAPVFFQSLLNLLEHSTRRTAFLFLLTGLSLTFMHPVILAYAVFIGGVWILFRWERANFTQQLIPLAILLVILLPQIALRFSSMQAQVEIPFTSAEALDQGGIAKLVTRWGDTSFYGFNLDILRMEIPYAESLPIPTPLLEWGWLAVPILSAILALRTFRRDSAAQFILACFLLCVLTAIPFTGWIIGYFLSAWMLARAPWLFPFGLSAVYAFSAIHDQFRSREGTSTPRLALRLSPQTWSLLTITFLSLGLFLLYLREHELPDPERFLRKTQRYKDLALAGQMLDQQISDHAYVMASPALNDLLPGISYKSRLITFRIADPANMLYYTPAEREQRIADTARLFSASTPADVQRALLDKYDVRFLLLQRNDLALFNSLIADNPGQVTVQEVGGVVLVQIE